jgi:hypothetical protein
VNRFSILTIKGCVIFLLAGIAHVPLQGSPMARPVQYVPLTPTPAAEPARRKRGLFGIFSKKSKRACVDVAMIAGAVVTDARNVELFLRDGTQPCLIIKATTIGGPSRRNSVPDGMR